MLVRSVAAAVLGALLIRGQSETCRTPGGEAGGCRELKQCGPLKALSDKRVKTPEDIQLLRQSACGFTPDGRPKVCCPGDWDGRTSPRPRPRPATSPAAPAAPGARPAVDCPASSLLPDAACCGRDAVGSNRIIGGNETQLDEYPWLALVEYHRELVFDGRVEVLVKTQCGGSLISSRYVLTAAHCLQSSWGKPKNVRLAEYNTSSFPKDCVVTAGGGVDCSDVLVAPIERGFAHPDFDVKDDSRRHDIGLFRLQHDVIYTDFIKPICLPSHDAIATPPAPSRQWFFVAGWGSDGSVFTEIKQHVKLPYVPMKDCQPHYMRGRNRIKLWNEQICAGGEEGRDTCSGDSGGPLMYQNGPAFEAVGVVSFGPTPCGKKDVPGVYTHVRPYVGWIVGQMRS